MQKTHKRIWTGKSTILADFFRFWLDQSGASKLCTNPKCVANREVVNLGPVISKESTIYSMKVKEENMVVKVDPSDLVDVDVYLSYTVLHILYLNID